MSSQANKVSVTSVIFTGCLHRLLSGQSSERIGAQEAPMALQLKPLHPLFAAEASGIDIRRVPDAATIAAIDAAMDRYAVLAFRDQPLDQDQQVAFATVFGT